MCLYPPAYSRRDRSKNPKIRAHHSPSSHISTTSHEGALNKTANPPLPPPKPDPKPPPPPPPAYPVYAQHTTYSTPLSYPGQPHYGPQIACPAFTPHELSLEHRRTTVLNDVAFVRDITTQLASSKPEPKEHKPNETEKEILADLAGLKKDWVEKERKDEIAKLVRASREEGLKEGRGAVGVHERSAYSEMGNWNPDVAPSILASVGMESLRRRERPRSRSRERYGDGRRGVSEMNPIYIQAPNGGGGGGRRDSYGYGEISDRLGRIENGRRYVRRRVVDAGFESGSDRVRFETYNR